MMYPYEAVQLFIRTLNLSPVDILDLSEDYPDEEYHQHLGVNAAFLDSCPGVVPGRVDNYGRWRVADRVAFLTAVMVLNGASPEEAGAYLLSLDVLNLSEGYGE